MPTLNGGMETPIHTCANVEVDQRILLTSVMEPSVMSDKSRKYERCASTTKLSHLASRIRSLPMWKRD